jgi:hypothetical protein
VTEGSAENKVVLSQAPEMPLVIENDKYAQTTYLIVGDDQLQSDAFLLQEKEAKDGGVYGLKSINYDSRYYEHDYDYAYGEVDVISPGEGAGDSGGYDKQAYASVSVPGRTMPWDPGDNPSYNFGKGDGRAPVAVPIYLDEGEIVSITAQAPGEVSTFSILWYHTTFQANTVKTNDQDDPRDADGGFTTGTSLDGSGRRYPTYYIAGSSLGFMGLVGCWATANSDGTYTVVEPFDIGFGGDFEVPAGGVDTLLLGINDTEFGDNLGAFEVSVLQVGAAAGDAAGADITPDTNIENDTDTLYTFTINGA